MKRAKRLYILLGVLAVLSVAAIAVIQSCLLYTSDAADE